MNKNIDFLHNASKNKSLAFSKKEREELNLIGLLPYKVFTQEEQMLRVLEILERKGSDIERYIYLQLLKSRNEKLYYRTIEENIKNILPIIYTPTVGEACKEFSHSFRTSFGFYINPENKGNISNILDNWPHKDVRIIVVTDGQRILGLGDLGSNGMGIPIGKLDLYIACAGIHPSQCLPIMVDVGTNNEELLNDILYLGYPKRRLDGAEYYDFLEEFVTAIQEKFPKALIQFEDFLTPKAYGLLNKYKDKVLCFNDDIQGTAAMSLAGIYSAIRITKTPFTELKILFVGAGSAATGIADLCVLALIAKGLTKKEAVSHIYFVDINGLVVTKRNDLMEHNITYAKELDCLSLTETIQAVKPNMIIGATGAQNTFNKEVIELMSAINDRPIIFALSNPTSKSECTAQEAYNWSNGKAIFASGSPFENVVFKNKTFVPGQGNNVYIFPGVGLGVLMSKAKFIPEDFFMIAAETLSEMVTEENLNEGSVYPDINEIRTISIKIGVAVANKAFELNLTDKKRSKNIEKEILKYCYNPTY